MAGSEMIKRTSDGQEVSLQDVAAVIQEHVAPRDLSPIIEMFSGVEVDVTNMSEVADSIERLRDMKRLIDQQLSYLTEVVADESKVRGTKTIGVKGGSIVLSPDSEVEWDVQWLDTALTEAGLPAHRLADLLTPVFTWKVDAAVAKQLAAANPEYADIIEKGKTLKPKRQYVSFKR